MDSYIKIPVESLNETVKVVLLQTYGQTGEQSSGSSQYAMQTENGEVVLHLPDNMEIPEDGLVIRLPIRDDDTLSLTVKNDSRMNMETAVTDQVSHIPVEWQSDSGEESSIIVIQPQSTINDNYVTINEQTLDNDTKSSIILIHDQSAEADEMTTEDGDVEVGIVQTRVINPVPPPPRTKPEVLVKCHEVAKNIGKKGKITKQQLRKGKIIAHEPLDAEEISELTLSHNLVGVEQVDVVKSVCITEDKKPTVDATAGLVQTDSKEASSSNVEEDNWFCDICDIHYEKVEHLVEHMKAHNLKKTTKKKTKNKTDKKLHCEYCNKSCINTSDLERHMRTHTGDRPYPCSVCGKKFKAAGDRKRHERTHNDNKEFECTICGSRFRLLNYLRSHMKRHVGERNFACDLCEATFGEKGHLKTHMRTHTGEAPVKCKLCNETFKYYASLPGHMKTIHGVMTMLKCELCDAEFKFYYQLRKHSAVHTGIDPFKCHICEYSANNNTSLQAHLCTHSGDKPFTCTTCDKTFSSRSHVNAHMYTHTDHRPHQCGACGKGFPIASQLKVHMKLAHSQERPFHCEYCSKTFKIVGHLNQHMKLHTAGKNHACTLCGFSCTYGFDLKSHIKRHHAQEKKEQCPHCPKTFVTSYEVKIHQRVHTGMHQYQCDICLQDFATKRKLNQHVSAEHSYQEIVEVDCVEYFGDSAETVLEDMTQS